MGVALPPPNEKLPEQAELELSKVAARASDMVLGKSKQQVAAQQAQQAQQDPIVKMQQAELRLNRLNYRLNNKS